MASSKADWVLGDARLISSASRILVKTGPLCSMNIFWDGSKIETPRMSEGRRSGVNWIRLNPVSMESARVLARVGPYPGCLPGAHALRWQGLPVPVGWWRTVLL